MAALRQDWLPQPASDAPQEEERNGGEVCSHPLDHDSWSFIKSFLGRIPRGADDSSASLSRFPLVYQLSGFADTDPLSSPSIYLA